MDAPLVYCETDCEIEKDFAKFKKIKNFFRTKQKALKTQCFQGFFGTLILGQTNDLMINSHALLFLCHLHGFIWTYVAIFTLKNAFVHYLNLQK